MKKITSLCLTLLVLFSVFLTPISATDIQADTDVSFTEKDELVPVDLNSIDGEVVDISAQTRARSMSITETETVVLDDIDLLENTQIDIENQIPITNRTRSNNSSFSFSGTIDTQNGMYIIAPILAERPKHSR